MEIKDDKVILNDGEAIVFGAVMQGMLIGFNDKIEKGMYLKKEEKALMKEVSELVQTLEEHDII